MGEVPAGFQIPEIQVSEPYLSASAVVSRIIDGQDEILLGHRVSEMPSFPDFWTFPGGGISKIDKKVGDKYPDFLSERGIDRIATIALLRELVEEIGLTPDKNGKMVSMNKEIRNLVCYDKNNWLKEFEKENIIIESFNAQVISERETPPFGPIRFKNRFFHVSLSENSVTPTFPPGRSEFDEFKWWRPQELLTSWEKNEVRIPPPIVTLLKDLVAGMYATGNLTLACELLARERPSGYHRIEFAPLVECFPIKTQTLPPATHTNCYILGEEGGERVIIDPAAKDVELEEFRKKISEIMKSGSNIVATIFTHKHHDHVGNIKEILNIYEAPIWATKETLNYLDIQDNCRILVEGDSFELKGLGSMSDWSVIETPGHCPGHICIRGESGIVSGDNCVGVGTILVSSDEGDMGEYISGLERLRNMQPKMLFPGHGPLIANPEKLLNKYIKHRKNRNNKIIEALRSNITNSYEICHFVYTDSPDANMVLANDQILSHLYSLIKENVVKKIGDQYYLN